jgi:diguanylate cyclase (GGDEF)-like protein
MHSSATQLLQRIADDLPVSAPALDQFNNALDRMRLELQSLRDELAVMALNRDPLTGAWSRATLLADLREQHALVRRVVQSCAIAMVDLDHFKAVNDTFGHAIGDEVLRLTARRQRDLVRPYDRLYRYGGEEFLLTMSHTGLDEAVRVAERLRAGIADLLVTAEPGGRTIHVTASIGVSELTAGSSVEDAIDRADQAMYKAKTAGRDRVEVAE